MAELLEAVASWSTLVLVVVVFGFAPGFCLRLIVLAYSRNDPRRAKLIENLYTVPRIQRPLWVAEQLEVALFEGLGHRISAAIHSLVERHRAGGRRARGIGSRGQTPVGVRPVTVTAARADRMTQADSSDDGLRTSRRSTTLRQGAPILHSPAPSRGPLMLRVERCQVLGIARRPTA